MLDAVDSAPAEYRLLFEGELRTPNGKRPEVEPVLVQCLCPGLRGFCGDDGGDAATVDSRAAGKSAAN